MTQADELLRLAAELRAEARPGLTFMEVCGTHTMAIARFGLRELLPDGHAPRLAARAARCA